MAYLIEARNLSIKKSDIGGKGAESMNVLVTGAGGFLGTELVRQLVKKDQVRVIAVTSQKLKLHHKIGDTDNIVLEDREAVFESGFDFSDIDVLINCAFPRSADGIQMADGLKYIGDVLSVAVAGGVKAVINISSQSVYSQFRENAADENTTLNLESKYAIGKYATELLTNTICKTIPHTNIRTASLIGVGFDQRLVNKFVKQVLSGIDICIKGGRQVFGFLDVRDAASAIIRVAGGTKWGEVYNLGPTKNYSLAEIAEYVQKAVTDYEFVRTGIILEKSADWQNSSLVSTRLREQFGWEEVHPLMESIGMIIDDVRSSGSLGGGGKYNKIFLVLLNAVFVE